MKRKIQCVWLILVVCVLIFISTVGNIKTTQAANFENRYYCETVHGTLKVEYTVNGKFGEYNQTTNLDDRCDTAYVNVSESLDIPVQVNIRRNLNSATYTMSVDTISNWSTRDFCHGDNYEYEQGSWINCGGTTYFNFTADGTHDLTGINTNSASEQTVDLTYKGCTYSVDVVFDDNPDWVVDWYNIKATLDRMTLTFTYSPYPEYIIKYDGNGGLGHMPSDTVKYSEIFTLRENGFTKNGCMFKGWAVIREADGMVFCDNRGWTPFNECQQSEWHIYEPGEQYVMDTPWFSDCKDGTFTFCAQWTISNYKVNYNADGGTLLEENGSATTDNVRIYEYDKIYSFLKAERAYTVSYETNGGKAFITDTNTNAVAVFNGWNEQLDGNTSHGEVNGWDGWSVGTWNWAAYYNGNNDLLRATNNTYDTMWAILHYREYGIYEGRTFNGASYWLPAYRFKNLTANGNTVNVKANYTNGSVILPKAEKASVETDGKNVTYTFEGWYTDNTLTKRVGSAGDLYIPSGNTTLYAKYTTQSENLIFNQKIRVRYENADGTWTSYTTVLDKDYKTGDTVNYDFGSLDTGKWVRPAEVKYTVSERYQTDGHTTDVDIYRQTYGVIVTYDNNRAFSAKSGEGMYRWGETVTVSVTTAQKNAQYTYCFAGFETDSRLSFRNGTSKASNPTEFIMPVCDVTLKARSDSQTNEYTVTVEHYLMSTDGMYPDTPYEITTKPYKYGKELSIAGVANEYEGFTLNVEKTEQINLGYGIIVTGEVKLRLYYDRNRYAVTVEHYRMDTSGNYPDKPSATEDLKPYYGEILMHKELAREVKGLSLNEEKTAKENGNRTQTPITGNAVIKLYYDRAICTVTYDYRTNGGTSADKETVKTYYGADADLYVAAYKNGWTHTGWNTKSSSQMGLAQYTVTGNVTLYAVYRRDITVTFVDFAQTYKREASMYNNDTHVLIDAPVCSIYDGWENVSDITAVGFNGRADITEEGAEKTEIKSGERDLKISENATYYTVCSAVVTLSYELNGGTENDTTKTVKKEVYCNAAIPQEVKGFALQLGECVKEAADIDGYTHSYIFATWAENSPESEIHHACNADYVLKENMVMYALWEESVIPITYYIEFDGNAGTAARNVPDKMEVKYGEEVSIPKQQPERTGFKFTGWNTRADGQGITYWSQDKVKNLTTVNRATVKLYAEWKQRRIILVKAASTVYNDTIIRRIPGDEEWYNSVGHLTIDELKNYPDELCEQVWHIDREGNITQVK